MASIIGCSAPFVLKRPNAIVAKASNNHTGGEGTITTIPAVSSSSSNGGRRELAFAVGAAAVAMAATLSISNVAVADDEPKRGTPEAKKKYSAVCVSMPTARICRK